MSNVNDDAFSQQTMQHLFERMNRFRGQATQAATEIQAVLARLQVEDQHEDINVLQNRLPGISSILPSSSVEPRSASAIAALRQQIGPVEEQAEPMHQSIKKQPRQPLVNKNTKRLPKDFYKPTRPINPSSKEPFPQTPRQKEKLEAQQKIKPLRQKLSPASPYKPATLISRIKMAPRLVTQQERKPARLLKASGAQRAKDFVTRLRQIYSRQKTNPKVEVVKSKKKQRLFTKGPSIKNLKNRKYFHTRRNESRSSSKEHQ